MVIRAKLVAFERNLLDYTTLVFKNLDSAPFGHNYVMTTMFPNWEARIPDDGEIGYLEYVEIKAGTDTWYDRTQQSFIPYNYNMIQFIKFVKEKDNSRKDILI